MAGYKKKFCCKSGDGYLKVDLEFDPFDWYEEDNTPSFQTEEEIKQATQSKQRKKEDECSSTIACPSHEYIRVDTDTTCKRKLIPSKRFTECPFDDFADELILNLFTYLPHSSLTKCVQVCKRWKLLGYEKSLWKEVNLDGKHITTAGVLGSILHRGVQILRLNKAEVLSAICANDSDFSRHSLCNNFPITQMDASMTKFGADNLACLLFRCNSLRCLSLEGCKMGIREITAISYNPNLEILNLALTTGLTPSALDVVTRKCFKLKSLNISWTNQTRDCLRYISRCKDLQELNLSGLRGGINRQVMEKLVFACRNFVELDLSDVTLQIGTMKLVADNCTRLQKLSISRCSDVKPEQLMDLVKLESLSHLNLFGFVNSEALERLCNARPDIYINKDTFSPIARPILTTSYVGRLWEQYTGFII